MDTIHTVTMCFYSNLSIFLFKTATIHHNKQGGTAYFISAWVTFPYCITNTHALSLYTHTFAIIHLHTHTMFHLRPCIPNFFPKFESSFESERVFRESRRDEMNVIFFVIFVRYFFVFSQTHENKNRKKRQFL